MEANNKMATKKTSINPIHLITLFMFITLLPGCSVNHTRATDYDQVGPGDKLILRFSYVTGEETPKGLAARKLKELIETKSNGKIEVQLFPNATLYSDEEELAELKKGEIQLIAPAVSKLSSLVPEVQIFDLPYLFSTTEDVWKLAEGPVGQELNRLLEKKGYKVLSIWDNGFKQITNNDRPIHNPSDFKGLTFRIMPSDLIGQQFETVEASSAILPFSDLYSALEKGKVDGEENTVSNIMNKKLYVSQKYITKSDHGYLGYYVLMDTQFWESIPKETQSLIQESLREVTQWEREQAKLIDQSEYQQLKKKNDVYFYELNALDKEKWKEAFGSTYDWYLSKITNRVIHEYFQENNLRVTGKIP